MHSTNHIAHRCTPEQTTCLVDVVTCATIHIYKEYMQTLYMYTYTQALLLGLQLMHQLLSMQINRLAGMAVMLHCLIPTAWVPPLSPPTATPLLGMLLSEITWVTASATMMLWIGFGAFILHRLLDSSCTCTALSVSCASFLWLLHNGVLDTDASKEIHECKIQ